MACVHHWPLLRVLYTVEYPTDCENLKPATEAAFAGTPGQAPRHSGQDLSAVLDPLGIRQRAKLRLRARLKVVHETASWGHRQVSEEPVTVTHVQRESNSSCSPAEGAYMHPHVRVQVPTSWDGSASINVTARREGQRTVRPKRHLGNVLSDGRHRIQRHGSCISAHQGRVHVCPVLKNILESRGAVASAEFNDEVAIHQPLRTCRTEHSLANSSSYQNPTIDASWISRLTSNLKFINCESPSCTDERCNQCLIFDMFLLSISLICVSTYFFANSSLVNVGRASGLCRLAGREE